MLWVNVRCAIRDHTSIIGKNVVDRWSEESFNDRFASWIVTAHFRIRGADQAIDVTTLIRNDIDQAQSRQQALWHINRINIRPGRHSSAAALLEPILIDRPVYRAKPCARHQLVRRKHSVGSGLGRSCCHGSGAKQTTEERMRGGYARTISPVAIKRRSLLRWLGAVLLILPTALAACANSIPPRQYKRPRSHITGKYHRNGGV